eukprot:4566239-Amphidinium_carterae.1
MSFESCREGSISATPPLVGANLPAGCQSPKAKYACGAIAVNNKIYCPPLEARFVLEIDPEYHEVTEIGADLGGRNNEKYSSIAATPGA